MDSWKLIDFAPHHLCEGSHHMHKLAHARRRTQNHKQQAMTEIKTGTRELHHMHMIMMKSLQLIKPCGGGTQIMSAPTFD